MKHHFFPLVVFFFNFEKMILGAFWWLNVLILANVKIWFRIIAGTQNPSLNLLRCFQKSIEIQDFSNGQADILAHSAAAIMERVNQGGSKTDRALKSLCRREKGLEIEVCFRCHQTHQFVSSMSSSIRVPSWNCFCLP